MGSYDDQIAAHKNGAKEACPALTEAQLEAVWAVWHFCPPQSGREARDFAVRSYLTLDCGISLDDAAAVIKALQRYDLCLF